MKTTILVFMAVITASLAHSVMAESSGDMMPPPGPYRSIGDVDQYRPNQNVQNESKLNRNQGYAFTQPGKNASEWARQRQAQMGSRKQQLNMPPAWNNQPTQWGYNNVPPMRNAYQGQTPGFQNNRMQQPFPSARGPVYGLGVPPAEFYNQPMQQLPRY